MLKSSATLQVSVGDSDSVRPVVLPVLAAGVLGGRSVGISCVGTNRSWGLVRRGLCTVDHSGPISSDAQPPLILECGSEATALPPTFRFARALARTASLLRGSAMVIGAHRMHAEGVAPGRHSKRRRLKPEPSRPLMCGAAVFEASWMGWGVCVAKR